jgi:hypothetical protein
MSQNQTTPQDVAEAPLQEVTSVPQLVTLFTEWVNVRLAMLSHLQDIPDGSDIELSNDEEQQEENSVAQILHLTGETLIAFRLGIQLALEEFSDVPFVVLPDSAPEDTPEANTGADLRSLVTAKVH